MNGEDYDMEPQRTRGVVSLREHWMLHVKRLEGMIDGERALRLARREDDLKAADKAERAIEARLIGMNELRSQIESERGRYATKADLEAMSLRFDTAMRPVEQFIIETRTRLTTLGDVKTDRREGLGSIFGAIGAAVAILGVIIVLANYAFGGNQQQPVAPVVTVQTPDITPVPSG